MVAVAGNVDHAAVVRLVKQGVRAAGFPTPTRTSGRAAPPAVRARQAPSRRVT